MARSDGGTDAATSVVLLDQINYAPFGAAQSWVWGNSSSAAPNTYARTFDLNGRLIAYPLGDIQATGDALLRTLTYDAASRITAMQHTGTATAAAYDQLLSYDGLDRLVAYTAGTTTQTYTYDVNGNRSKLTLGIKSYANTIGSTNNRLLTTAGPTPAKNDSFDAAGNLISDGTVAYFYSDRGRLAKAVYGGIVTSYTYNGLEQRVSKAGMPTPMGMVGTIVFAYDEGGRLLGEYDVSGVALQETVYLGALPVAVLRPTASGAAAGTAQFYVYADHINTPRVIVDAQTKAVVWRWDLTDPFGLGYPTENPSGQEVFTYNQRFPGQYYDWETNLFHNGFRDYDAQTGRYIESDPIGLLGGINTYVYVDNQPTLQTDPLGLMGSRGNPAAHPPCKCPKPPPSPPGASVCENMKDAKDHYNPKWYYDQVRNKGPWDYKQQGSQYQDFGNFNYGATGSAFGWPDTVLERMAGWAQQQAGTSKPEWNSPYGSAPYGDDPSDQEQIRNGIEFARCKCR